MKKQKILITVLSVGISIATVFPLLAKAQDASTSEEIRKKVQEKIMQVSQKPKAFIGTITDISESTIQINRFTLSQKSQEKSGEILQVAYNKDTVFLDNRDKSKQVKAQDLAIGDFIIAMGIAKSENILESSRIINVKPLTPTTRTAFKLNVNKLGKQEINAISNDKTEYLIKINKDTKILDENNKSLKIDDIDKNMTIIAVGETTDKTISARTIFLIENSN
ncbi:MAG: hypothetical protein KatS3mg088_641 [Patescibacteria group bacterium]|nr:MAG: hypothetical protein KatS3mg088_641 [Patescibacteria group bacterium]